MKIFYFSFLFVFLTLSGFTQEVDDSKQKDILINLSGEIISKEDGETVPYVHIINVNTNEGTTSDLSGKFNIQIHKTDSLIFSAVGFERYSLTLVDNDIDSDAYYIRILLDRSSYELSPVNIYAFKDEAGFKQDILNLKLPDAAHSKIVIPGSHTGPVTPRDLNGGFSLGSPISSIANVFSKEAKELRKYERVLKDAPRQKTLHEKYNVEIVEEITGLKDEELNQFMLFCKIPEDYILKANDYEIILAVNECYKEFLGAKN